MKNCLWICLCWCLFIQAAGSFPEPRKVDYPRDMSGYTCVLPLPPPRKVDYPFPEGFYWGSATAAYQVEGGLKNDWSARGVDAGNAVNHWERYREDFQQMASMGHKMYRMSVSWARLEPTPGQFDDAAFAQYKAMLQELKRQDITPMVTLFHFTSPTWFAEKGGWENPDNLRFFERFVTRVARELGPQVYYWNTLNEPLVYAFRSYDEGEWPPFVKDRSRALQVVRNLILAHGRAYTLLHQHDPVSQVGFAKHVTILEPHWPLNPLDQAMTGIQHYLFNELFWDTLQKGQLDLRLPGMQPLLIKKGSLPANSLDFIGLNYYSGYQVRATGALRTPPEPPHTELNWPILPEGMYKALRLAHTFGQHLPIIVTENGLADHDDNVRPGFLLHHLQAVHRAIAEGIPVMGYLHWSLIDNFEWTEGFSPRFGLMDERRRWRNSARVYQRVIQRNGFDRADLQKYPLVGEAPEAVIK